MNSSTSSSEPGRSAAAGESAYLLWYVSTCVLLVLVVGVFNWGVDPLQVYRKAEYPPVFSDNQRYQNPGLARHYPYETVIIGTSHAENFLPSDGQAILGERTLKLAISGSTAREQRMILEQALSTGRVRRVIWVLNFLSFRKPLDALSAREGPFPHHLYVRGLDTIGLYLLSLDTVSLSLDALAGRGHTGLEDLNTWHRESQFDAGRVIADYHRRGRIFDAHNRDPQRAPRARVAQTRASIERNLLSVIARHPEVEFDLVFPPYSVLLYLADHRQFEGAFEERLAYKAFVVEATAERGNVRVHDFQIDRETTHDLDRYKDLEHYDIEANRAILEGLRNGRAQVEPSRYADVLAEHRAQVEAYRRAVCDSAERRALCPRVAPRRGP